VQWLVSVLYCGRGEVILSASVPSLIYVAELKDRGSRVGRDRKGVKMLCRVFND
jgi:hypothetical protein